MQVRATRALSILAAAGAIAIGCGQHVAAQLHAPADEPLSDAVWMRSAQASQPELRMAGSLARASTLSAAPPNARPWDAAVNRVSLIEMPSYGVGTERFRPHYALGFSSETMRAWMSDLGIDAENCVAPIIRLRTRIDAGGEFRGSLWVHARCAVR